jgi:ParB family chromosome partitioning protein
VTFSFREFGGVAKARGSSGSVVPFVRPGGETAPAGSANASVLAGVEDGASAGAVGADLVDTATIRPSRFYNRYGLDLNETADPDFCALLVSVREEGGNAVPVLLYRAPGSTTLEVVYGHRRVSACRAAGLPVRAVISDDLSEKDIGRLQVLENSQRKNPSILDLAGQIESQLESKVWGSQAELGRALGFSAQYICMLYDIAQNLPKMALQMAHPDHHKITYRQANGMKSVAKEDPREFKRRLDWVQREKATLSGAAATEYLLKGESVAPKGPSVALTGNKNSTTLKVRGLSMSQARKLHARLEALLQEMGLSPP